MYQPVISFFIGKLQAVINPPKFKMLGHKGPWIYGK